MHSHLSQPLLCSCQGNFFCSAVSASLWEVVATCPQVEVSGEHLQNLVGVAQLRSQTQVREAQQSLLGPLLWRETLKLPSRRLEGVHKGHLGSRNTTCASFPLED